MSPGSRNTLAAMPGPRRRLAATAAIAAAALGLAACGSEDDGTIPRDDAEAMLAFLSEVQSAVDAGACTSATTDASQFVEAVNQLPKDVGTETKEELRAAGENLVEMTQDETKCAEPDEDPPPDTGTTGIGGEQG
jgi:hypothetical protein